MAKRNQAEESFNQRKQSARLRRRWSHAVPQIGGREECPDCYGTAARWRCTTCDGRGWLRPGEIDERADQG